MELREEVLRAGRKQRFEPFEAFGQKLSLRKLKAGERDWYDEQRYDVRGENDMRIKFKNVTAAFVCIVLGDEHGERVFTESDMPAIGEMLSEDLVPIVEAGLRFNGMDKASEEALRKNSETTLGAAGFSGSPGNCAVPSANCSTASMPTS